MASLRTLEKFTPTNFQSCSEHTHQNVVNLPLPISRRSAVLICVVPLSLVAIPQRLLARERRSRKNIPIEDYLTTCNNLQSYVLRKFRKVASLIVQDKDSIVFPCSSEIESALSVSEAADGLKYYDIVEGKGPIAVKGSTVQVHFDCLYRGITAVSSRESKLLAGNRSIAQPYEFQIGAIPGKERKREFVDNPNGLFSAQAAPKPPKALYTITEGMRVGGKRTVIIPPEAGYGSKGMNEIPPNSEFEMNIELLQVMTPPEGKLMYIPIMFIE